MREDPQTVERTGSSSENNIQVNKIGIETIEQENDSSIELTILGNTDHKNSTIKSLIEEGREFVVIAHGWPGSNKMSAVIEEAIAQGKVVVEINYVGDKKFRETPEEDKVGTFYLNNFTDGITTTLNHLKKLGATENQIKLVGCSMGGRAALEVVSNVSQEVAEILKSVTALNPVLDPNFTESAFHNNIDVLKKHGYVTALLWAMSDTGYFNLNKGKSNISGKSIFDEMLTVYNNYVQYGEFVEISNLSPELEEFLTTIHNNYNSQIEKFAEESEKLLQLNKKLLVPTNIVINIKDTEVPSWTSLEAIAKILERIYAKDLAKKIRDFLPKDNNYQSFDYSTLEPLIKEDLINEINEAFKEHNITLHLVDDKKACHDIGTKGNKTAKEINGIIFSS